MFVMELIIHFEDVPDNVKKRAEACKTPEELLALAAEEGYELTDEGLAAVAGGAFFADCTWDECKEDTCKLCKGLCDKLYH